VQAANIVFAIDKPVFIIERRRYEFRKLLLVKILATKICSTDLEGFYVLADMSFDAFWQADG